jgi:hypothetical protein
MAKKKSKAKKRPVAKAKRTVAKSKALKKKAGPAKSTSKTKRASKPASKKAKARASPVARKTAKKNTGKQKIASAKIPAQMPISPTPEMSDSFESSSVTEPNTTSNVETSTS